MTSGKPSGSLFQINLANEPARPWPYPDNKQQRIDWALAQHERQLANLEWLDDDRIPCLSVYSGTEIFAEAFGCKVHRSADNMPFALPLVRNSAEAAGLRLPRLDASPLASLFDIADTLQSRAGQDAIFQIPDVQSPLDIAALIWEKTDFYIALLEEPAAVFELMHKIKMLLMEFFDTWFARYGREYIAHFPYYFMQGGLTISEDEVGVINSDLFNEFALPDLSELSGHFGGLGMHCCANARHQWANFKKIPGLRLLNLVQPDRTIAEAYRFFAGHTCQMHSWCGDGEPAAWPAQHPPAARIVYEINADGKEAAIRLADELGQVLGR